MNNFSTPGLSLVKRLSKTMTNETTHSLKPTSHSYRYIISSSRSTNNINTRSNLININQSTSSTISNISTPNSLTTTTRAVHNNRSSLINTNTRRHDQNSFNNVVVSKRNQSQSFLLEHVYGLVFLGAPGVGKGTYSKLLAKEFGAKVLSSGDLIRECAKENVGTALGNSLTSYINSGQLVPDDIVIPMVVDYLRMLPSTFILDGFPRTIHQAERIHNEYEFHCVLKFNLPDHILMQKILGRRICTNCGSNFNIADIDEGEIRMPSMAPKIDGICDNCGYELSTRPDDTKETVEARMKIFGEETGPIEDFYRNSGLLIEHDIKKGIDDMPQIINTLKEFLERRLRAKEANRIRKY